MLMILMMGHECKKGGLENQWEGGRGKKKGNTG
jgi:hypothetical protein